MYCPKCGKEYPDNVLLCSSCSEFLANDRTKAQKPKTKRSQLAIASFVLAVISIEVPPIAIPAIILGIVGFVVIEKSGGRLTGRVLAIGGIVIPVFVLFATFVFVLPRIQRIKKQAITIACLSKLKQWGLYFSMYAEDYNGRFMAGYTAQPQANGWISALGDYYKWDDEFTCCPNATKPWMDKYSVDSGAEGSSLSEGVTMAWGYMNQEHWKKPMKGSYGINGWVIDPQPGREPYPERGTPDYFWRGPSVMGAGKVPLFLDAQHYTGVPLHTDTPPSYSRERLNDEAQMRRFCLNRHDGFVSCLLLDYSVRKIGLKELWTLKWHRAYQQEGPWTRASGCQPDDWPEWMRRFRDY